MTMPASSESLSIAAFAADGELVGTGRWTVSDLSPKWVNVCQSILREHGPSFRASFGRPLAHIELKFDSSAGSALCTFFANGEIAMSSACVSGLSETADREVLQLFRQSLLREPLAHLAASDPSRAFQSLFSLPDRPLAAVVCWGNPTISEEDTNVVRELGVHLAGAFFSRIAAN